MNCSNISEDWEHQVLAIASVRFLMMPVRNNFRAVRFLWLSRHSWFIFATACYLSEWIHPTLHYSVSKLVQIRCIKFHEIYSSSCSGSNNVLNWKVAIFNCKQSRFEKPWINNRWNLYRMITVKSIETHFLRYTYKVISVQHAKNKLSLPFSRSTARFIEPLVSNKSCLVNMSPTTGFARGTSKMVNIKYDTQKATPSWYNRVNVPRQIGNLST